MSKKKTPEKLLSNIITTFDAFEETKKADEEKYLESYTENEKEKGREDESGKEKKSIFEVLSEAKELKHVTNFEEAELMMIYYECYTESSHIKKGPKPHSGPLDDMVCLLTYYNTNFDLEKIKRLLDISSVSVLESNMKRARSWMLSGLKRKWWDIRIRPKPLDSNFFPHAALIVDSTSIQIYKPSGPYVSSIYTYDGKNHIYALKKEVAVMASEPHYALFSQPAFPGSCHDVKIHQQVSASYYDYLLKTPLEKTLPELLRDENPRWSILCDMGYTGPDEGFRRIFPKKLHHSDAEYQEITKKRVYVENFFGRMKKLWSITKGPYRGDISHFDEDIDLCVLLTNESIEKVQLVSKDREYLLGYLASMEKDEKIKKTKTKRSTKKI